MLFYLALPFVVLVTIYHTFSSMVAALVDKSGVRYHNVLRRWSKNLLWLLRVKVHAHGAENLPLTTNYVYLASHSSYLDILALGATVPDPIRFIFKEEITRVPIFGWGLALGPYIQIDRADARNAMASIEKAAGEIRDGASVVIFPEGTRTSDGRLGPFKRGGFMLATRSGVPMVPVAIQGSYELLSRRDWKVKPGTIDITFGTPIQGKQNLNRAEEQGIQKAVREQLLAMLGQEDAPVVSKVAEG
ncbi:MAG: 1-acyl-sn-glycerol-3-phosphate acyltransferase [Chlorobi bacterium]|nr:1-acyl-sn-glycerol-3-phosphate acyltransferase [Chlorobiota bacterium]